MDTVVVYGIEEDDATFASLNREKSASFADTLFRSDWFPKNLPTKEKGDKPKPITAKMRKQLSRLTDHTVKFLWARTGAKLDPFAPRRTPTEALRFLSNHKRVLECVYHIFAEDEVKVGPDDKKMPAPISQYLPAGLAAALMYLMATSESDGSGYRDVSSVADRSEKKLKFTLMDKAKDFWSQVAGGDLDAVRKAMNTTANSPDVKLNNATASAIVVKAWKLWIADEKITPAKLSPVTTDKKGNTVIDEPNVGGIDTAGMTKREIRGDKGDVPETPAAETTEEQPKEETQADAHRRKREKRKAQEVAAAESNGATEESGEPITEEESGEPAGYAE